MSVDPFIQLEARCDNLEVERDAAFSARAKAEEDLKTLRDLMAEVLPHIGNEYERSWPEDSAFEDMLMRCENATNPLHSPPD